MAHVALYSPYIPKHRGGGEKYLLSLAEVASRKHKTSLLVPPELVEPMRESLPLYESTFGLDLSQVDVLASSIGGSRRPVQTAVASKKFSHLFAMTDGSIFPSFAGKSYFIIQVPWTRKLSIAEQLKLKTWSKVLVYSDFVKGVISKRWKPKTISVLSPYVDLNAFQPGDKQSIILNVGRFFRHTTSNSKRQDVCIEAFKKMINKGRLTGYSLVLAGNVDPNPDSLIYLEELKNAAFGYPVNLLTDLSYPQLRAYYAKARFYWHAAGFGINPQTAPENTEHFGMTTLEAMASGCIPMVIPYGGQKEIVTDVRFFWERENELMEKMDIMLSLPKKEFSDLSLGVREKAKAYSKDRFEKEVEALLK